MKNIFRIFILSLFSFFTQKSISKISPNISSSCCFFIDGTKSLSNLGYNDNSFDDYKSCVDNSENIISFGSHNCIHIKDITKLPLDEIYLNQSYSNEYCQIDKSKEGQIIVVAAAHCDKFSTMLLEESSNSYIAIIDALDKISEQFPNITTAAVIDGCSTFPATQRAKNTCVVANANHETNSCVFSKNYHDISIEETDALNWGLVPPNNMTLINYFLSGHFLSSSISAFPWNQYLNKNGEIDYASLVLCLSTNNPSLWCDRDSVINKMSEFLFSNQDIKNKSGESFGAILFFLRNYQGLSLSTEDIIHKNFNLDDFNIAKKFKEGIWNYMIHEFRPCLNKTQPYKSLNDLGFSENENNYDFLNQINIENNCNETKIPMITSFVSKLNQIIKENSPIKSTQFCKIIYDTYELFSNNLKYFLSTGELDSQDFLCIEYGRLKTLFPGLLPNPYSNEIIPRQELWHNWIKQILNEKQKYILGKDPRTKISKELKSSVNNLFLEKYEEMTIKDYGPSWTKNISQAPVRLDYLSLTKLINDFQLRFLSDESNFSMLNEKSINNLKACQKFKL